MEKNQAKVPLTLEKEEELERVFQKFDTNGDGKISPAELRTILNRLGSETSVTEVARIMSEFDSDGDGFIDLNEFKVFYNASPGGDNKKDYLKEAFDIYDKDKDGNISESELHEVLWSLGEKCSVEDCRRMISSVDLDGDGCVNFEEFKRMMMT